MIGCLMKQEAAGTFFLPDGQRFDSEDSGKTFSEHFLGFLTSVSACGAGPERSFTVFMAINETQLHDPVHTLPPPSEAFIHLLQ